jgi:hypothetical protein
MKNIPKILLAIFLIIFILQMAALIILLLTSPTAEAAKTHPMFDPSCWLKTTCEELGGYWEDSPACGGDWGRCYPGTKPITIGVKIEGVGEVKDVAEYIALIYKYAVGIGAILATVMILWGGIVYLTAGGAPEKIKSAKDYISNALIGLVLLYTSYLLLQTLNPDLVKLQMPRVYMLRPISLGAEFCKDIENLNEGEKFAKVTDKPADYIPPKGEYTVSQNDTWCKEAYMWETGASQTCWGSKCNPGYACAPKEGATKDAFECAFAVITGTISYTEDAFIDNDVDLYVVCNDGKHIKLIDSNATDPERHPEGAQTFAISAPGVGEVASAKIAKGMAIDKCGGQDNVKGFYLSLEVDDPGGSKKSAMIAAAAGTVWGGPIAGVISGTIGYLAGIDDYFAVGTNGNEPIYEDVTKDGKPFRETDPDKINWNNINTNKLIPPGFDNMDAPLDSNKRIKTSRTGGFLAR